ncbi:MAG: HlyD family efflux transporter periplasmic adaptor subunit [Cyanobacteria bacterium P01_F01_bin.42]
MDNTPRLLPAKFRFKPLLACICTAGLIGSCTLPQTLIGDSSSRAEDNPIPPSGSSVEPVRRVIALGRIRPSGEVLKLSVPNAEDSRVNQILAKEGDYVEKGDVIAILQGHKRRNLNLEEARKSVLLQQAHLENVRAGSSKQSEVSAQEASIRRLEAMRRNQLQENEAAIARARAELVQAQNEYDRNSNLHEQGVISSLALEQLEESLSVAKASLQERLAQLENTSQTMTEEIQQENELLESLGEVRPEDIRIATIELEQAKIAVRQREADLEDTLVRVPISGQILRFNTKIGERVNTQEGIAELGQTNQMIALAEVYESDISKVERGYPVKISSENGGFEGQVEGVVDAISLQVGKRTLSEGGENPFDNVTTRIVEVRAKINPEDNPKVSSLTNLQVRVEILIPEQS